MIDANATASTKELAEFLGIPTRTLNEWARAGIVSQRARGRWHLAETVKAIVVHLRMESPESGLRGGLIEQQTRLARARADAAAGTSIPAADAAQAFAEASGILVSEFETLAPRLTGELVGVTDAGELRHLISIEVKRARQRVSDQLAKLGQKLRGRARRG